VGRGFAELAGMDEEETASQICGRAREAVALGDDEKALMLFAIALAKAEAVHGPESMIVGLILCSLMDFHIQTDRQQEAHEAGKRLETILERRGVVSAEIESIWLPQIRVRGYKRSIDCRPGPDRED